MHAAPVTVAAFAISVLTLISSFGVAGVLRIRRVPQAKNKPNP